MLSLNVHQRYFLYRDAADMRKGFDGLCGLVRKYLIMDPLNTDVFVFLNKRRSQVKLLCWEKDGFILFHKRLEQGTFELPEGSESALSVDVLSCMLHGIKLRGIYKRKRYDSTKLIRPVHAA